MDCSTLKLNPIPEPMTYLYIFKHFSDLLTASLFFPPQPEEVIWLRCEQRQRQGGVQGDEAGVQEAGQREVC